jgi:isocitrate dehydrogenase (NAD+)
MHHAALIRGDGIGPEICDAAVKTVEASGASVRWEEILVGQQALRTLGAELPVDSLEQIRRLKVGLKAPMIVEPGSGGVRIEAAGGPRMYPSVNNALRRELGAFVNLRPVRGWHGVSGRYETLDLVIVREVTEDVYLGEERRVGDDAAEAIKRISGAASRRVARFACEYAIRAGRKKLTAVHKANVLHLTDGLFLQSVRSVVSDYPTLESNDQMVDAAFYHLVKHPELFDVLVLPNQYGDIMSDLAAGLVGSLGLAPGANIGPEVSLFEAAHGAAPDIAGRGIANPIALILSAAMLLDHIGEGAAGERIRRAVAAVLGARLSLTPDLGGTASTEELTSAICAQIEKA